MKAEGSASRRRGTGPKSATVQDHGIIVCLRRNPLKNSGGAGGVSEKIGPWRQGFDMHATSVSLGRPRRCGQRDGMKDKRSQCALPSSPGKRISV